MWFHPRLQALALQNHGFRFRRMPQTLLARRPHRAGNDAVDADAIGAQIARQSMRQTFDASLGCHVDRQVRLRQMPGNRPKVEDYATAFGPHGRRHGLGAKILVAQVHGDAFIPIGWRHVLQLVAVVVGSVVDKDIGCAAGMFDVGKGIDQGCEISQVAIAETRWLRQVCQLCFQCLRSLAGDIEKGNLGALARKCFDDGDADAGAATCDDDVLVGQAWIGCMLHKVVSLIFKSDQSKPRWARLWYKARTPNVHGAIASQRCTSLTNAPSFALAMVTRSPRWCVKPPPGTSRSFTGENMVPRKSMKPSGYW